VTYLWQVWADIAIGAAVPLGAAALYWAGRLTKFHLALLAWGFAVGSTWEFANYAAGESYHAMLVAWPMPRITVHLWHTFWDAGLFFIGYLLCVPIFKATTLTSFRWEELGVMWAWGVAQEFGVELLGNGVIWEYQAKPWNPVWLVLHGRFYTLLPQFIWMLAPIVFYLGALVIKKRSLRYSAVGAAPG
jgi:hypothetical protein